MVFTIHQHESAMGTTWKCSDSQMFENLWLTIFPKISPFSHLKEERASSKGTSACVCVLSCFSRVWLFATLWTVAQQAPLSMGFSSKNTGVGCHALLQGIFPTQGSNPCSREPREAHMQEPSWRGSNLSSTTSQALRTSTTDLTSLWRSVTTGAGRWWC